MSAAIPDYVEPFGGWRVWRVGGDGRDFRLLSLVQETVWPLRQELVAECRTRWSLARRLRRRRHEPPAETCGCGIYATGMERLGSYLEARDGRGTPCVFGRVLLRGTVAECEHGWRASRAYPAEIFVPTPRHATAASAFVDEIAHGLSRCGVAVVVLPVPPPDALDMVAHDRGRLGFLK